MKFTGGYVLNSEIKRISLVLAGVMSEKYDSMVDRVAGENGLGYRITDRQLRLLDFIGIINDRSNQDDDNESRCTSGR